MKKFVIGLLVSFLATQAHADKEYVCIDLKTGADAGKIRGEYGHIIYSNMRTSTDGWILTITEDGNLFNADPMVQQGRTFYVGTVGYESFQLLVTINNHKMTCE